MLFRVYPSLFYDGPDRNNNGVIDIKEDDTLVDYRYRENLFGFEGQAYYDMTEFLRFTFTTVYETLASDSDIAALSIVPEVNFHLKDRGKYEVNATVLYKRVRDSIVDDVSEGSFPFNTSLAYDSLDYTNSDVFSVYFNGKIHLWQDLFVKVIERAEVNLQHVGATERVMQIKTGNLFLFDYTVPLYYLSDLFEMKVVGMAQSVETEVFPFSSTEVAHTRDLAVMTTLGLKLSTATKLTLGYQYLDRASKYDTANDLIKNTGIIEFESRVKANGRFQVVALLGVLFEDFDFKHPTTENYDKFSSTFYFRFAGDL